MQYRVPQVGKVKISEGKYFLVVLVGVFSTLAFLFSAGIFSTDVGRTLGVSPFIVVGVAAVVAAVILFAVFFRFTKQYHAAVGDLNRWSEEGVTEFARLLSAQHGVSGFDPVLAREALSAYELSAAQAMEAYGRNFPERFAGEDVFLVRQADGVEVEVLLGRDRLVPFGRLEDGDWELVHAGSDRYSPLPRVGGRASR